MDKDASVRREDILKLLFATPYAELRRRAARITAREKGSHVFVRGLVEFSNVCRRNCRYCGLRAANRQLVRYTLSKDGAFYFNYFKEEMKKQESGQPDGYPLSCMI